MGKVETTGRTEAAKVLVEGKLEEIFRSHSVFLGNRMRGEIMDLIFNPHKGGKEDTTITSKPLTGEEIRRGVEKRQADLGPLRHP